MGTQVSYKKKECIWRDSWSGTKYTGSWHDNYMTWRKSLEMKQLRFKRDPEAIYNLTLYLESPKCIVLYFSMKRNSSPSGFVGKPKSYQEFKNHSWSIFDALSLHCARFVCLWYWEIICFVHNWTFMSSIPSFHCLEDD